MNNNKIISLTHLLDKYDVTVWDTCALSKHLNGSKRSTRDYFFIRKLTTKIKEGHICIIPQAIIKEMGNYESTNFSKIKARNELMEVYDRFSQNSKLYLRHRYHPSNPRQKPKIKSKKQNPNNKKQKPPRNYLISSLLKILINNKENKK